jgi:hypothetical protein
MSEPARGAPRVFDTFATRTDIERRLARYNEDAEHVLQINTYRDGNTEVWRARCSQHRQTNCKAAWRLTRPMPADGDSDNEVSWCVRA